MELAGRLLAYLLSVGVLGGLVFAMIAFGARSKALKATGWRTVPGIVTRPPGRLRALGTLGAGLRYQYDMDGHTLIGSRVRLLDWPALLFADAAVLHARLSKAGIVEVRVNPKLADDSVLDLAPPPAALGWTGLAFACACGLLMMLRRLL
ncbi:hypothetical protein [Roseixanthobacter glucoisosaccharinicivorans]|uniref:hypothetical protein n=1 Tax=Roseixanthobacter glucoisosaccharinicivorans TaxID=3119923 RepID=UPI00372BDF74